MLFSCNVLILISAILHINLYYLIELWFFLIFSICSLYGVIFVLSRKNNQFFHSKSWNSLSMALPKTWITSLYIILLVWNKKIMEKDSKWILTNQDARVILEIQDFTDLRETPANRERRGTKVIRGTKDKKETEEILVQEAFPEKGETKGKLDHVGFQELWDHLVTQDNPDHVPAGAITYHLVFFSVFWFKFVYI